MIIDLRLGGGRSFTLTAVDEALPMCSREEASRKTALPGLIDQTAPMAAFPWLVRKILLTKVRKPGAWFTFQEFFNMVIYACMGLALLGFRDVVDAPLSPSPEARALPYEVVEAPLCAVRPTLLFAPLTADTQAAADGITALLSSEAGSCSSVGFPSADALLAAFLSDMGLQQSAMAGILFNQVTEVSPADALGDYTIAMSRELVVLDEVSQRDFEWPSNEELSQTRIAYEGYNDEDTALITSGFTSIQWAADRAIAAAVAGTTAAEVAAASGVQVTRFPLLPFESAYAPDSELLGFLLPLFALVPAFTMSMLLTQFMLNEKVRAPLYRLRSCLYLCVRRCPWI
jgi:hypothetical protein